MLSSKIFKTRITGWPGNGATCKRLFGYCSSDETNGTTTTTKVESTTISSMDELVTGTTTMEETDAATESATKQPSSTRRPAENRPNQGLSSPGLISEQPGLVGNTESFDLSSSVESHTSPPPASSSSSPTSSVLPSSSSSPPQPSPPTDSLSSTPTPSTCASSPDFEVGLQRPALGLSEEEEEEGGVLSKYRLGPLVFGLYSNLVISLQVVAFLYLLPKICLPKFVLAAVNDFIDFVNPFNTLS